MVLFYLMMKEGYSKLKVESWATWQMPIYNYDPTWGGGEPQEALIHLSLCLPSCLIFNEIRRNHCYVSLWSIAQPYSDVH